MMAAIVPSPIGHALAGTAVALIWERLTGHVARQPALSTMLATCIALAVLPDADLLYIRIHRTVTHSFTASALALIITAGVTRQVTGRINWSVAVACALAVFSHMVMDWLGQDFNPPRGIQALWPFSDEWFVSDWSVFRSTVRRNIFSMRTIRANALAALQETALLAPVVLVLWLTRRKRHA